MIRTVVCEKEGCSGNIFSIESEDGRLKLICKNCLSEYYLDTNIMILLCYQFVPSVIMMVLKFIEIQKVIMFTLNVQNVAHLQKKYI